MRTGIRASLGLAAVLAGYPAFAAPRPQAATQPDPATTMRRIAARPYRYGGSLGGTIPGSTGIEDQLPAHISIGLDGPDRDGRIRGEAILFTADRRLIASSNVDGDLRGGSTPGTGACTLHMTLRTQQVTLTGLCSAGTLSGEIVSTPAHVGLLTRVVAWWDDRSVAGRYWLTPESFDPASS